MQRDRIEIGEETTARKAFVWAVDWPGWCRGGKDATLAREALLAHAECYSVVAMIAGLVLPAPSDNADLDVVESVPGAASTAVGVPHAITAMDRRPTTLSEAERLASLVEATWTVLDRMTAAAPPELRKGPRGGGRDRDKMLGHVIESDHAYACEIGLSVEAGSVSDRAAVEAARGAVLEILRQPSDGSPLADRKWPLRYAARRIAWHALDHAWEMEDRTQPNR